MKKFNSLLIASRITGSLVAGLLCLIIIPKIIEAITREGSYLPENNSWEGVFDDLSGFHIFTWILYIVEK